MTTGTAEQKIIYAAYMTYASYNKTLDVNLKSPIKQKKLKDEILAKQIRFLISWRSDHITSVEKDRLVTQSKLLYVKFCKLKNVGGTSQTIEKNMDEILDAMAVRESEVAIAFKKQEAGGKNLDLSAIFSEISMVNRLINESIKNVLAYALKDHHFTVVSKHNDTSYFITASGKKYHRKGCPYCVGKNLIPSSFAKIENMALLPCKCISTLNKEQQQLRAVKKLTEISANIAVSEFPIRKKQYFSKDNKVIDTFTVFIDESIRHNPTHEINPALPETQANYSYVICKGKLMYEKEIIGGNTLYKGNEIAVERTSTQNVAIEAIENVLMKIAFQFRFFGTVIIYTDNVNAQEKWAKIGKSLAIAELFEQIIICYVPRKMNTIADNIGKSGFEYTISEDLLKKLVNVYKEHSILQQRMKKVLKYFPDPEKQIPNLIAELELLAGKKEISH